MTTVKITPFHEEIPNHPNLSELFNLISSANPLVVAQGSNNGEKYVIVTSVDKDVIFTFTEQPDGYSLVKSLS